MISSFQVLFREKVLKGYEGEEEIYFGNGFSIAKKNRSLFNDVLRSYAFIYDFGHYKAKKKNADEFDTI